MVHEDFESSVNRDLLDYDSLFNNNLITQETIEDDILTFHNLLTIAPIAKKIHK